MDIQQEVKRWQDNVKDTQVAEQLSQLVEQGDEKALADAFFQDLEFGTGGLRGIIGAGTNRMNVYTVAKATQGLADYLNRHYREPSIAIARDSRNNGELFVRTAASVMAANGVFVRMYPRIEPTPALSYAVRTLHCASGICMTASHNPAEYNGYKVYDATGCQITSQIAQEISDCIADVDTFHDVLTTNFDQAVRNGMIDMIHDVIIESFINRVLACSMDAEGMKGPHDSKLKLVYTPLNGTGLECIQMMLDQIGVTDVTVVPSQKDPDGNFPTCPYPNPEIREALQEGLKLCETVQPDLLLATDPDADRVGIAVRDSQGEYQLLTGNEVGVLLLDYLCRVRRHKGTMPEDSLAITTIVSTPMVDDLAAEYGFSLKRTLTGFKYIGEIVSQLEREKHEDRFLMGFEESYGYLMGPHVRDKDSISASMVICQMAEYYKSEGVTLVDAMDELYKRYGYYKNRTISLSFPGADGAQKMDALMAGLRAQQPSQIAGFAVQGCIDYRTGHDSLPPANVIEYALQDGHKVIVRPSGTEPKIKAYLFTKGASNDHALEILDALEAAVRELLK